jgi:transcriptional regulator with XRE-family HTH domain
MDTAGTASALAHDQYFSDFPAALRYWRRKRGYSQLQLSTMGAVSQRHLSFIESGRAQPSRELILKLGIALEIPLRQRNIMLLSAGFAPAYQERKLSDPELAAVRQALDFMLAQQAPYPALVVDRLWNLQLSNEPAAVLVRWLLDLPDSQALPGNGAVNVIRLMLDPNGVRRFLVNWQEVGADLLQWLQREAMSDGPGSEAGKLLAELAALAGGGLRIEAGNPGRHALPFLPVSLLKDGVKLKLFTTIATLGTPRDVTLHELRIESFFPADEATAQWFRSRGDGAGQRAGSTRLQTQDR